MKIKALCSLIFTIAFSDFSYAANVTEYYCKTPPNTGNLTAWFTFTDEKPNLAIVSTDLFDRLNDVKVHETVESIQVTGLSTTVPYEGKSFYTLVVPKVYASAETMEKDYKFDGLVISTWVHTPPANPRTSTRALNCRVKFNH